MDDLFFTASPLSARRAALDAAVWSKSEGHCWYCGVEVLLPPPLHERGEVNSRGVWGPFGTALATRMYIDHFHSVRYGGGDELSNLVPSCRKCNCSKGPRDIEEFRWTVFFKRQGISAFNLRQREWLIAQGFDFSGVQAIRFWFEREGLEP